jgi:site-specific DNA-methyltransferase (adenine-specific)
MRTLPADSVDAIVTDPPYGLEFMGKAWDGFGTPLGFQTWTEQWAREALRVLKPGGHLLAFGGTRMYHRLAAGIEDAGFEIRDTLMWLYGSGFPKSLDVSKAIDKAAGAEREVVEWKSQPFKIDNGPAQSEYRQLHSKTMNEDGYRTTPITAPSTEAAKKWQGWGTALKPAVEPIVLARKPLIGTVAENVLTHGTGALNIDASRIGTNGENFDNLRGRPITKLSTQRAGEDHKEYKERVFSSPGQQAALEKLKNLGRWPANILLDEEAAALLDEQSGESKSGAHKPYARQNHTPAHIYGTYGNQKNYANDASIGGASRFFYVAKASRSERNFGLDEFGKSETLIYGQKAQGPLPQQTPSKPSPRANIHPTVKPVDLIRYLIRLVTPKGGTVLDPFMGSGTMAVAAIGEGVNWIGCEREPEYVAIIEARIAAAQPGMGLNLEEDIK